MRHGARKLHSFSCIAEQAERTSSLIFEIVSVKYRNKTPHFVLLTERVYENIHYLEWQSNSQPSRLQSDVILYTLRRLQYKYGFFMKLKKSKFTCLLENYNNIDIKNKSLNSLIYMEIGISKRKKKLKLAALELKMRQKNI